MGCPDMVRLDTVRTVTTTLGCCEIIDDRMTDYVHVSVTPAIASTQVTHKYMQRCTAHTNNLNPFHTLSFYKYTSRCTDDFVI